MSTELTTQERIVLVYNPSVQNQQVHFTSRATTYGQLREELVAQNIVEDMSAWKVMEGRTRVTLEHDEAMLPTNIPLANKPGQVSNDLILIMTQKKMDLGAITHRQEIMADLKRFRSASKENEAEIKRVFGNYTQMKNEELIRKYHKFMSEYNASASRHILKAEERTEFEPVKAPATFEEIIQRECDNVIKGSTEIVKKCEEIVGSIAFILKEVQEATKQGPNKDLLSELEDIKRLFV